MTDLSEKMLLQSLFHDESPLFRTPAEPAPGEAVTVRLRCLRGAGIKPAVLADSAQSPVPMQKAREDDLFDWYEAQLRCPDDVPSYYSFLIGWEGRFLSLDRRGVRLNDNCPAPDPAFAFGLLPGFHVPDWARGALQYQIFPDRFFRGGPDDPPVARECFYAGGYLHRAPDWDALPEENDYRCLYGGDLPGVMAKLDYLQSLGVEAVYFNPLFVSPSSHKYDTQDYDHIDPHFAPSDGMDAPGLPEGDRDNAYAVGYIRRTTDPAVLDAADAYFAKLCNEMHRRGMRVILDGVFNHCGSFHRWMNREGIYLQGGAYADPDSPWGEYFRFTEDGRYECWWDVETLPKLNYEGSSALCEEIFRVAQKWLAPPYRVDGWRLDVAADLGHSPEFNHLFWREFRRRVKAVNPEALIIAEHYGTSDEWLNGLEWDSVMNYDGFMEPVSYFLTGLEKHSDARRDELYQNGHAFFAAMAQALGRMPQASRDCAMTQLSNHDHSRFMTRTNRQVGRLVPQGAAAADEGIDPDVFREAVVIQMTWPGAPTIYYGDEAGLTGWTDPDNRRTYPWGREDKGLIALHRSLAALRKRLTVLKRGSLMPLIADHGLIAYARFDEKHCACVICNNGETSVEIDLPLRAAGVADGATLTRALITGGGYDDEPAFAGRVEDGQIALCLPARSAAIYAVN